MRQALRLANHLLQKHRGRLLRGELAGFLLPGRGRHLLESPLARSALFHVALEPLDGLVEAGARAHVHHAVLAPLAEELLHPVDVHRLRHQLPEHEQPQR